LELVAVDRFGRALHFGGVAGHERGHVAQTLAHVNNRSRDPTAERVAKLSGIGAALAQPLAELVGRDAGGQRSGDKRRDRGCGGADAGGGKRAACAERTDTGNDRGDDGGDGARCDGGDGERTPYSS